MNPTRRHLITAIGISSAGFLFDACTVGKESSPEKKGDEEKNHEKVTATEDLMREHGILRRALLVYAGTAPRLRSDPSSVAPDALQKTAKLFRAFGEDYHEKKLEETYIFPGVKGVNGRASSIADILIVQHQRGREITDYILAMTQGMKLGAANAESLTRAMESFVLMYQNHAAREDTIVFPAWKQSLSAKALEEMGDKFEEIEHQQFGEDGFEEAERQISDIEEELGLADIAQFTAPAPPTR
jgi:hemerythrin-like domain-containing protein